MTTPNPTRPQPQPPAQPTTDYLQAAAARTRLRERQTRIQNENRKSKIRWLFWTAGLILLIALLADLQHVNKRINRFQRTGRDSRQGDAADILRGLETPARYSDPSGWFSLVPPLHWRRIPNAPGDPFNVMFRGPYDMDMGIQVVVTNGLTFDKLVENLRDVERRLAASFPMEFAYIGPHRAIKRSAQLYKHKILALDFVTGNLAHHIQFSIPNALYDEYEPILLRLMQTYQPGQIIAPADVHH